DLGLERVEGFALVFSSVDEDRDAASKRDIAKICRRLFEKSSTGQRQVPDHSVSKGVVKHGCAAPRRMETNLIFGLKDCDTRLPRQRRGGRHPADPAPAHTHAS